MKVRYDKLWRRMKDNKLKKSDLAKAAEISSYTMTKLNKDLPVSMETMMNLCKVFHCDRYVNGQRIKHTITPVLGEKAPHNGNVVYSLDFQVTPHQLRHTYITNLIYAGVDPKTVQYLAGHENSKITMDIYAKVKYNSPDALSTIVNTAFNTMYAKAN